MEETKFPYLPYLSISGDIELLILGTACNNNITTNVYDLHWNQSSLLQDGIKRSLLDISLNRIPKAIVEYAPHD